MSPVLQQWKDQVNDGPPCIKMGGANGNLYVDYKDPRTGGQWSEQVKQAKRVWDDIWHYWFNGRAASFEAQAAAIHQSLIKYGWWGDKMVWDVESEGTSTPHWEPNEVVAMAHAMNAFGMPMTDQYVYMSSSLTKARDWSSVVELGIRLWVADYGANDGTPSSKPLVGYWPQCNLWQYTSVGRRPGYGGNLDLNLYGPVWTVHALQGSLNNLLGANLKLDGIYGDGTRWEVRNYQGSRGLGLDGVAGRATLLKLESELGGIPSWEG